MRRKNGVSGKEMRKASQGNQARSSVQEANSTCDMVHTDPRIEIFS